jgi:RNA polymerase sigma-70 factor (ECF subfamily)
LAAHWDDLEAQRAGLAASLRGVCASDADIEDCVQEAILRVAQLEGVDPRRVRGLLRTVAFNLAMDLHRDRRRQSRALARIGPAHTDGPDVLALDAYEAHRLARHARRLSFRERAALRGRAEGFAPSETATILGDTSKSVHLALARARTTLKRVAGGALVLLAWRARRLHGGLRAAAPTLATLAAAMALVVPLTGHPPSTASMVAPEVQWAPPPPLFVPSVGGEPGRTHPPRGADHPVAPMPTPKPSPPLERTIVQQTIGSSQTVQVSAAITAGDSGESPVVAVEHCLQPGALSLDPYRAGCKG